MRVGIVCGGGIVSGKEIMVLSLASGLRDAGLEVKVVNSKWSDGSFAIRLKECDLPSHAVWFGFISATLNFPSLYMTAAQVLRWPQLLAGYWRFLHRFRPNQVIHTNWHSMLTIYPFLRPDRDIFWVHEVMPNKPQYRWVFRIFARRIDGFVAVSDAAAKALIKIGVPAKQVRTIPNGITDPSGGTAHDPPASRSIGIIGQIGAWKGHEDLIDAFRAISPRHPDAQLHIFGRGSRDYESFLRSRIAALELSERVTWHGFVSDRKAIYARLSIVVAASRFEEPFGLTAVEAAFFGIPVVASRRGGLTEIIEDGVTGLLFEAGDAAELAKCLIVLLEDGGLRAKMGDCARDRARNLFSRSRFVRDFTDLLQSTKVSQT